MDKNDPSFVGFKLKNPVSLQLTAEKRVQSNLDRSYLTINGSD